MVLVAGCAIGDLLVQLVCVCVWVFYGSGYGCLAVGMGVQSLWVWCLWVFFPNRLKLFMLF